MGTARRRTGWVIVGAVLFLAAGLGAELPPPRAMAAARRDVWGEAALRQPDGPSYAFFRDLLPPVRYVNTAFRHYPVVLCAPAAPVKARWVSNGSAVNARADSKPMWREVGSPVSFHIGPRNEAFGSDLDRIDGPRYAEGWLPIVHIACADGPTRYEQEAFAPVREPFRAHGVVFVRFTAHGGPGTLTAAVPGAVAGTPGAVCAAAGRALVLYGDGWRWDAAGKRLAVTLTPGQAAVLAVATRPLPPPFPALTAAEYDTERAACAGCWKALLGRGVRLEIPEPIVQDAWRSLVVGNFLIAVGDRMHYSAGNAYDHLYESECGDAVRSLLLYGFQREARAMIAPLLAFQRQATRCHVAGHKLQLLSHYYWVTRDAGTVRAQEPAWKPAADFIRTARAADNGLMPKDNYAGDVKQQVHALSSNAACWRGLRDLSAVLADLGQPERAGEMGRAATAFRQGIRAAVGRSVYRDTDPPFIPNALYGVEKPHDPLTATRMGSYYDLMTPYTLGSEVLGPGSERETWLIEYLRRHGGVSMGMIRSTPHQGRFKGEPGANALYGLRYVLTLLRRDDRGHALAGFYGQLAQAMTRGTFIGAENTRFLHGDARGRSMYLPPNSASNATFLLVLRYLLVQDWDLDDDGRPDTLRLLYGAPGRWLRDGASIRIEGAPTAFGPVSLHAASRLARGEVVVTVDAPPRRPERLLVRPTLPPGWTATAARADGKTLPLGPDGAADVSGRSGRFTLRFAVQEHRP